jgi:hypothetical protein
LSQTDLLTDCVRPHRQVVAVARRELLKSELPGHEDRSDSPFRIVLRDRDGRESDSTADVVIDATGVFSNPNWLGPGGAPAWGESSLRVRIRYDVPDVAGTDRERFANRRVLVIGCGHSAATTVAGLADSAAIQSAGAVVWATRAVPASEAPAGTRPHGEVAGPVREIPADPLPERARLARRANQLARAGGPVTHWPATTIQSVAWDETRKKFHVVASGEHASEEEFDEIVANVGFRPDSAIYAELQVHECYATGGPMKLAARRLGAAGGDCLQERSHGADSLRNPEPDFYILGAKSYGRDSNFLVAVGHQQIRDLFSLIGDRANLDLYQGAASLPK